MVGAGVPKTLLMPDEPMFADLPKGFFLFSTKNNFTTKIINSLYNSSRLEKLFHKKLPVVFLVIDISGDLKIKD